MDWTLPSNASFPGAKGPVVLVILDGVGIGSGDESDAVQLAKTPCFDDLKQEGLYTSLRAHGTYVGLPSMDDMGNSEVGHNALGSGRVHDQGASLVGKALASGALYEGAAWIEAMGRAGQGGALHFIGLLSDGNVHSHQEHLFQMMRMAAKQGAKKIYVHPLMDGRDVPPTSGLEYVAALESVLGELRDAGVDARVASGGGRMTTTMDRYGADWPMVKRGWDAHVHGEAERSFPSLQKAVETFRSEKPGIGDQDLPTFVITGEDGKPVAPMKDGDAVLFFNFRGDRAIELSQAFDVEGFDDFDRGEVPDVSYAGMMEYDGDLHLPKSFLVAPPEIEETMGEYLAKNQVSQLAISETQKYGHVTYFWNGNKTGMFDEDQEDYLEISSDTLPFEERPWMKAAEITDALIQRLRTGKYRFARVNYANGDMVGHTGDLEATICAVQVLDLQLRRLRRVVEELEGILVVTADHGNADEMFQHGKDGSIKVDSASGLPMVKTSHTLNPVPFVVYDPARQSRYRLRPDASEQGIANVAATCLELLGFKPPQDFKPSLLQFS